MADVFISYKREEIAWAARVGRALSEEGFSAFYDLDDDGIHAGEEWDKRLEKELADAKCCVVLWSSASTQSPNVRSEARRANNRGILVPAKINACQAPLGLDALQEADLRQWRGDRTDAQWRFLVDRGVARKVGRAGRPPKLAPPPPPPQPLPQAVDEPSASGLPKWLMPAGAAGLALVALLAWSPWNGNNPPASEARPLVEAPASEAGPEAAGPVPPAVAPAPAASFVDARSTPAGTRAPLVSNPSSLPDYAVFRECDGCPEMVVIPAGSFTMGSPASEAGRESDEGPQVSVRVPRFAIARFETTWDEWAACVSTGACQQREDQGFGRGRRPVIDVDWETETRAFVRFVNSRASGYRLPSEAEWEYAARAGTTTAFPWGATASRQYANYGAEQCCSGQASGADQWVNTSPVGSFRANPWGLYDMHGNVWELVEDCYRGDLSGQTAAAHSTVDCSSRVLRGGSWNLIPQGLRSAFRIRIIPSSRSSYSGFRLARTL